ncbi:MAG: hypothetical protein ACXACK_17270 [Candidatus Hodarchaeales archaeon]
MSCEARCSKCYFKGGRRQDFDENDLIWYCSQCKKVYFCDIGLTRSYDHQNKLKYSCPHCGSLLINEEVDKIIIDKKMVPKKSTESHEVYHQLMSSSSEKTKKEKFWRRSSSQGRSINAFEHSQISELNDVKGLTLPLIFEFTKRFKIKNFNSLIKIKSKRELLSKLAEKNEKIIPFLYSALFGTEPTHLAFELRFGVFISSKVSGESKILLSTDDKCDLTLVEPSGDETLIYCVEENLDLDNLELIARKAFSGDFKKSPKMKRIFLVAKSFSYIAIRMIKKYQSVLTGIEVAPEDKSNQLLYSLPIILWQPTPNNNIFEKISFN